MEPEVKVKDGIRQKYLEQYGIKLIRVSNEDVLTGHSKVYERIIIEIKERKRNSPFKIYF